jgi:hypothetical protein
MKTTMVATRTAAPPMLIPMIAPNGSFDADGDEEDFASAAGAAEALLVLEDVVDEDEVVVPVVEGVEVGAALVAGVVEDC